MTNAMDLKIVLLNHKYPQYKGAEVAGLEHWRPYLSKRLPSENVLTYFTCSLKARKGLTFN